MIMHITEIEMIKIIKMIITIMLLLKVNFDDSEGDDDSRKEILQG